MCPCLWTKQMFDKIGYANKTRCNPDLFLHIFHLWTRMTLDGCVDMFTVIYCINIPCGDILIEMYIPNDIPVASFPGFSTVQFLKALMLQLDGRETGNKCPRNVPLLPCIPDPCSQLPVGTMTSSLTRSSPRRAHSRRCLERSRSWFRAPLMATMSAFLRMDR